jgi:hypothetical protein
LSLASDRSGFRTGAIIAQHRTKTKPKIGNQNNRGDLKQPFQDIPGAIVRKFLMSERLNSHQL